VRRSNQDFTYHKESLLGPILLVLLFTTPVELFLLELFVPWTWLRWLLGFLGVYAFIWLCGLYASLVNIPHSLTPSGIRLSYGILASGDIPYQDISSVTITRRSVRGDGFKVKAREKVAYFIAGGKTDITLYLRRPRALQGWLGPTKEVTTVHLAADEPEHLVRELRPYLAASAG